MERKFNNSLTDMKRDIYRLINQDGTNDILNGVFLIGYGLIGNIHGPFSEFSPWNLIFSLGLYILGIVGLNILRRRAIYPRIGIVRAPSPSKKHRNIMLGFIFGFFILFILSIWIEIPISQDLENIFENSSEYWGDIIFGAFFITYRAFYGIWLRLYRLLATALVFLYGWFFGLYGEIVGLPSLYCQIILLITAGINIGIGSVYLYKFLKKYPMLEEGIESDHRNENLRTENKDQKFNGEGLDE